MKDKRISGFFSAFYSQRSIVEAWTIPSPWSNDQNFLQNDRQTNQQTDKVNYRSSLPELKNPVVIWFMVTEQFMKIFQKLRNCAKGYFSLLASQSACNQNISCRQADMHTKEVQT